MRRASPAIVAIVEPVVSGLGYALVGAEIGVAENGQTLRVYIDTRDDSDVDIQDCVAVSQQLNAVLDVEDAVPGAYQLEVSSPGVDRPLFDAGQFRDQLGETVRVRLLGGLDGRRNFKGRLLEVNEQEAVVEVDGTAFRLPLQDVEHAYLVGRLP